MQFTSSPNGTAAIVINKDVYISFGKEAVVKFIHIRYPIGTGATSKLFPVPLLKLPKACSKAIGTKNLKLIRTLVREKMIDGTLQRKDILAIGDKINSEKKA